MAVRTDMLIITLNVNVLNAPTKRRWLAEWIQKAWPMCILSTRDPYQDLGAHTDWKWGDRKRYSNTNKKNSRKLK